MFKEIRRNSSILLKLRCPNLAMQVFAITSYPLCPSTLDIFSDNPMLPVVLVGVQY